MRTKEVVTYKIRRYNCHPETCAHWKHEPYELYRKGEFYTAFEEEREMRAFCKDNNMELRDE